MKQRTKIGVYLLAGWASAVMLVPAARAQFDQTQDVSLFLGFRNAGANDYVVNLGTISSFLAQGPGTINIAGYSASDLNTFMGGFNSLTLSVFGTQTPNNELIMSRARTTLGTQTTPWNRQISTLQGNTASKVRVIGNEAESYGATIGTGANNTPTAIVEPDADFVGTPRQSYAEVIGANGNFGTSFSGNIEGTTAATFTAGGTPLRLDLYDIVAGSGASTFVGFFDFNTDGTMTFTVVPEAGTLAAGVTLLMVFAATQRRRIQQAMGLTK